MAVSYKKLWKMLIDKDMKKKDLAELADVSSYTITKMSKGENVTTDTLGNERISTFSVLVRMTAISWSDLRVALPIATPCGR